MTRFVVVQDCWRWALVNEAGELVAHSDNSFDIPEAAVEDLEQSQARKDNPDTEVAVKGK